MTMYARIPFLFAGIALASTLSTAAHADDIDEIQRRDLALIKSQLAQIDVIVDRLEARQQKADPNTVRLYFDIPYLRRDLRSITSGIDAYLTPDRSLPRHPQPMKGDYLDDRGQ